MNDVVVVGSGLAGTSAALSAARRGAKVLLLEKLSSLGGSTALSAGMFWTAPTMGAYQKRIPLGKQDLGQVVVLDYAECVEELRELGVRVAETPMHDIMTFGVGYSTDIHAILERSWEEIRERGGAVKNSTAVREVLRDVDGVIGVRAELPDGSEIRYAARGVILATGGFQGDPALRSQYLGTSSDRLVFRSNKGSVGDGLRMARGVGAGGTTGMSTFYGHLLPYPMTKFEEEDFLPASQYYSSETLLINLRGKRFADETLGDEILNQRILHQPEARGVLIFDEHVHQTAALSEPFPGLGKQDRVQIAIDSGGMYLSADSLDELAKKLQEWELEPEVVARTIATYVESVKDGGGVADGVPVSRDARAPQTGPFHALMVQPSITFTFGGIPITPRGEVSDADGQIIRGLYSAGADIGGLSNEGYAGGLAPAYITGRRAGRAAAEAAQSRATGIEE